MKNSSVETFMKKQVIVPGSSLLLRRAFTPASCAYSDMAKTRIGMMKKGVTPAHAGDEANNEKKDFSRAGKMHALLPEVSHSRRSLRQGKNCSSRRRG
jgi:hypothetical protein